MDDAKFDDLLRAASGHGSRRGALRALTGAALGGLGLLGREDAKADCRGGRRRCGGRCRPPCPDVMTRNRSTCRCECPDRMVRCGQVCVDQDRCCPGEKECGGGCIREEDCCTYTHKRCPDGSCLAKDGGVCCPDVEVACPNADDGCCNSFAGEECATNGCCNTIITGHEICDGKCVYTRTDKEHCGGCGRACDACSSCIEGDCRSNCGEGRACCGRTCCPTGHCHEGKYCCAGDDIFCPGTPGTCCRSGYHCKVDGTGKAYCSSNP